MRQLRVSIAIETPIIVACLMATVGAYFFHWHILAKVALTLVTFMQLMHPPGLFTRLAEQRRKLAAAENRVSEDDPRSPDAAGPA